LAPEPDVAITEAGVIEGREARDAAEERARLVGEGVEEEVIEGGNGELLVWLVLTMAVSVYNMTDVADDQTGCKWNEDTHCAGNEVSGYELVRTQRLYGREPRSSISKKE
jgi:hypothetical protein